MSLIRVIKEVLLVPSRHALSLISFSQLRPLRQIGDRKQRLQSVFLSQR